MLPVTRFYALLLGTLAFAESGNAPNHKWRYTAKSSFLHWKDVGEMGNRGLALLPVKRTAAILGISIVLMACRGNLVQGTSPTLTTPTSTLPPTSTATVTPTSTPLPTVTPDVWSPSLAIHATHLGSIGFGEVTDATWSPDGKLIAVSSSTTIRLYEELGSQFMRILGTRGADAVAFSPDGTKLAAFRYGEIDVYNIATGQTVSTMSTTNDKGGVPTGLAYSSDGKSIYSSDWSGGGIHIWDASTGTVKHSMTIGDRATTLATSRDGTQLAVGNAAGDVMIWDTSPGVPVQNTISFAAGSSIWVNSMAYNLDGTELAVTNQYRISIYNPKTADLIRNLGIGKSLVFSVAYSPKGNLIAWGDEQSLIHLANPDTGASLRTIQNPHGSVSALRFSPDGSMVLSLSNDQGVRVWDVSTGALRGSIDGYVDGIFSVAFSNDGKYLFTGERLSAIRVWDVATTQLIATLVENSGESRYKVPGVVERLAISPDSRLMASLTAPDITLWDLPERKQHAVLKNYSIGMSGLVFTPDGSTLISTSGLGALHLWDVSSETDRVVLGNSGEVWGISLADNDEFMTVGGSTFRFYNWKTGRQLKALEIPGIQDFDSLTDVTYSKSTRLAAIMDTFTVEIWDVVSGQRRKLHEFSAKHGLEGLNFDPTGRLLAIGSDQGTVTVLDSESGSVLTTLNMGGQTNIMQIAFSPTGRLLAVATNDGEVQLWGINTAN